MPAALPGSSAAQNAANPSAGQFVFMDGLSGPKGSPFDAKKPNQAGGAFISDVANLSTGGLSTGIGFGANHLINIAGGTSPATAAQAIKNAGFNDDVGPTTGFNSTRMYIGGGKGTLAGSVYTPVPWTTGFRPVGAGNGGSRDGGAGPAFTGFLIKMVTAVGAVANGAVIETGFVNRSGIGMVLNDSAFGSESTAQAAPA